MSSVGDRIEERMRELGIDSANEVGRRASPPLPGQTITSIIRSSRENPKHMPRLETLERLAGALNTSVLWLQYGSAAAPAPRDLTVDRTAADPPPPASRAAALQRALWDKARELDAEPEDYDAARAIGNETAQYLNTDGDVLGFAEDLLRAVRSLRRDGVPVNAASVLTRYRAGRTFGAEDRMTAPSEAMARELDELGAAAGVERGAKKELGAKMGAEIAAKRAKREG